MAIWAKKLGAATVVAVDYDEWSVKNASENVALNGCDNITVKQQDTVPVTEKFDIVLANINLNVLLSNISAIAVVSLTGAYVLLSGILKENEEVLVQALQVAGLQYLSTTQRGDWIAVTAIKP